MPNQIDRQIVILGDPTAFSRTIAAQVRDAAYRPVTTEALIDTVAIVRRHTPDLVIVALPLDGSDGAACEQIRLQSSVPIIAISLSPSDRECRETLESGADDYLAGPCNQGVLEARIMAAIRRATAPPYRADDADPAGALEHAVLQVGSIRLDLTTCRVSVDGAVSTLTPNEFRLLAIFMRAPGEVFTREDLRRRVWPDNRHSLHLVEVHIANLRAKIERDPHHPVHIVTVRSKGYRLSIPN